MESFGYSATAFLASIPVRRSSASNPKSPRQTAHHNADQTGHPTKIADAAAAESAKSAAARN